MKTFLRINKFCLAISINNISQTIWLSNINSKIIQFPPFHLRFSRSENFVCWKPQNCWKTFEHFAKFCVYVRWAKWFDGILIKFKSLFFVWESLARVCTLRAAIWVLLARLKCRGLANAPSSRTFCNRLLPRFDGCCERRRSSIIKY